MLRSLIKKGLSKKYEIIDNINEIEEHLLLRAKHSILFDRNTIPVHVEHKLPDKFYEYSYESIQLECSAFYCATLKNGQYISINGQDTILYRNNILQPLSFKKSYFNLSENWVHPLGRGVHPPKIKHLKGSALVLSTIGAGKNYGHWIIDLLPRLGFAEYFGFKIQDFDHILINRAIHPFQKELIDLVGLPKHKIIETDLDENIMADMLVVPSNSHQSMYGFRVIREKLLKNFNEPKTRNRRVYLTRRRDSYMKVVNEEELTDLLQKYHFEIVDIRQFSVRDQIKMMMETNFLISAQGSGLANINYMSPSSNVIEIYNKELINATFLIYGLYNNVNYGALLAEPITNPLHKKSDIYVDINKLEKLINKMLN